MNIGIDPGVNGFITVFDGEWKHYPIPKIGTEVDVNSLSLIFKSLSGHAVIEDVHAIFGSSAKATFKFGWITGLLEGFLVANNISFQKVAPKTWQKIMWVGIPQIKKGTKTDTKAMSEMACKRLFPNINLGRTERCTTVDDNKVDSILLCEYSRRINNS